MANGLDKDKWLKLQPSKRKADKGIEIQLILNDIFFTLKTHIMEFIGIPGLKLSLGVQSLEIVANSYF